MTYHAVGRSGEVQFLEFSDTIYDPFFNAAVPLWMEPKTLQKYSQILVHTKYSCGSSYLADVYHSLGSFWSVEDGLYRSDSNTSSKSGFYFPQLHSLRSDWVSSKITASIRSSIEDKNLAKNILEEVYGKDHQLNSVCIETYQRQRPLPDLDM